MTKSSLDLIWKAAIQSQPEGSFLFPENVVVEELLEHIDNTWTTLWEGTPSRSSETSLREETGSETSQQQRNGGHPKKRSWLNRTLTRLRRKKEKPEVARSISIDRIHSLIPRFPSWVVWKDGEEVR